MPTTSEKLANLMAVLPVIIIMTFTNVIISFVMGMTAFLQLIWVVHCSKTMAEILAVLVAVAVHFYIWGQPIIRGYITRRRH